MNKSSSAFFNFKNPRIADLLNDINAFFAAGFVNFLQCIAF